MEEQTTWLTPTEIYNVIATKRGDSNSGTNYAYAFGLCFAMLTKEQHTQLIKTLAKMEQQ
jgi:hypothetical protein